MGTQEGRFLRVATKVPQRAVVSSSPFAAGARSAKEACARLCEEGIDVTLPALRWFQNENLVDKPGKVGRHAFYPREILDEVASMRVLQELYGRSVEDLLSLRRSRISFSETVRQLLWLEKEIFAKVGTKGEIPKMVSPDWGLAVTRLAFVREFFEFVLKRGVRPGLLEPARRKISLFVLASPRI